jgi:hypothetical protein
VVLVHLTARSVLNDYKIFLFLLRTSRLLAGSVGSLAAIFPKNEQHSAATFPGEGSLAQSLLNLRSSKSEQNVES